MKKKLPSTCLIVVGHHLSYFTNSSHNTTKPSTKISKKIITYFQKRISKRNGTQVLLMAMLLNQAH